MPIDPFLGRRVGNYRVERKLGEGGMGAVYLLQHTELAETFQALKVLTGEAAESERAQERFRQEALVAAAVGSHRVARPIDLGRFDDGTPFIIFEFVAGRSLLQELHAVGPLSPPVALKIAARIADTMASAHQKGIIHRDLKPANVMLTSEGRRDPAVRLLDFGVARATGSLKVAETGERAVIGTPGYLSPEAVLGVPVDGRADVFSLGILLFEMLTGRLPFPAPTVQEALVNVLQEPLPPLAAARPRHLAAAPPWVDALLAKAMAKRREERLTMADFRDALVEGVCSLVAGEGGGVVGESLDSHLSLRLASALPSAQRATLAEPSPELARLIDRFAQPSVAPTRDEAGAAAQEAPRPGPRPRAQESDPRPGLSQAVGAGRTSSHGNLAALALILGSVLVAGLAVGVWLVAHRGSPDSARVVAPTMGDAGGLPSAGTQSRPAVAAISSAVVPPSAPLSARPPRGTPTASPPDPRGVRGTKPGATASRRSRESTEAADESSRSSRYEEF